MSDLLRLSASEIAAQVSRGGLRASAVIEAALARIAEVDPQVHAFLSLRAEPARRRAEEIDQRVRSGARVGSLAGVPVAVKDNLCDQDGSATCASRILERFRPSYSATALRRVEAEDAIVIGKTNLDEFAMGSSNENSAFGPTRNPWDLDRVPGGSSGGSAAAVAAGEAVLSLGSDTGGSVRQPAAFCGLVALKPQYGHLSRHGLVAFASSLDQIGPMARSARDCALLFNAVAGHDPRDATSLSRNPRIELAQLETLPDDLRLGVPRAWLGEGLDPEIRSAFEATCASFEACGAHLVDLELPDPRHAISTYYILANAEASSNLARFDGVRYGHRAEGVHDLHAMYERSRGEGFGPEVKRRILMGTFVLSSGYYEAFYAKAQAARRLLRRAFDQALETVHAILIPTAPTAAFRLGEKSGDPLAMYLSDIYTITSNLVGHPAVSFPAGATQEGLPIGMQLCGRAGDERTLLALVQAHEGRHDGVGAARSAASPVTGLLGRGPAGERRR
ncbi:MAG: Asp-tRNA(Asn)/Glu-tRNA(Gln) amidotransferase subunit GatA [Candidatus Eisenbacteria bacterium]|nr:Asp-tRNA(Asn)/Glu-tRNA(Gln) amidotransferase subunit GatA [Candidatus Eisenbacteria bacterium]